MIKNEASKKSILFNLDRRSFIKFLGALGSIIALKQIGVKITEAREKKEAKKTSAEKKLTKTQIEDKNTSDENTESKKEQKERNPYTKTAIETSLMMIAKYIVSEVFNKLKIPYGNASLNDEEMIRHLKEHPVEEIIEVGILAPLIEEAMFRAFPAVFIDKNDKRKRWEIGIPTSLLFALLHILG